MSFALPAFPDLGALPFDDVVDVRAPSEYAEDHIPGAINLPVLSDAERARVGTIYVRQDRFLARKVGAALVSRNAACHLEGPLADRDGSWRPLIYCWRGGQRSGSFATILSQVGWRVEVLDGGYRSYRRAVKTALYDTAFPCPVIVIDGGTGTAKTRLLNHLAAAGAQVLDLEGLADHRGSNFGGWGRDQPSQKMFESRLLRRIAELDPVRPVFVEAESNAIGRILLPPSLWRAMGEADAVRLTAPLAARARHLIDAYPDLTADADRLAARIDALRPYRPRDLVEGWHDLARAGDFAALCEGLIEHHYDPAYARGRKPRPTVLAVAMEHLDEATLARTAARIVDGIGS
ncbi:tRNA 2-selenouridine(34) synthase MnmH [Jannaschia sp. LMIT008]|uniref:tRNA 2-selenouridine(34) synthase MnmH n=1 Tax=Jannaschia maritima TaxID=3032585 RepID=UPI002810F02A|nr:tRNA 2-selenouridine(34) synthase MnmH [Jannaschia sp. LMIT008]